MTPSYFRGKSSVTYIYKLMSSQMSCLSQHMFSLGTLLGVLLIIELFIVCTEQRKFC